MVDIFEINIASATGVRRLLGAYSEAALIRVNTVCSYAIR